MRTKAFKFNLLLTTSRCLAMLALLLFASRVYSQEKIYLNDGTTIEARVTEIGENAIKYKLWDQPDGPIRNISSNDVSEIHYQDGKIEHFSSEDSFKEQVVKESFDNEPIIEKYSDIKYYEHQLGEKKLTYSREGKIELLGSLKLIKNQNLYFLKYDYSNLSIGGMDEGDYIDKRIAEHEKVETGSGEIWKNRWYADRSAVYEPNFETMLNKYLAQVGKSASSQIDHASFTILVHTSFIEPGYHVGVSSSAASLNAEIYFIDNSTNECVAKIMMKNVRRSLTAYDAATRIGIAYTGLGKRLGKYLIN